MATVNSKLNSGEIIASLRDITVTYDGYRTRSLSHVNVDFRRGEVTGVLGAKGAGKSTLLKILAGRLAPAEGVAKVVGRSPRNGLARARIGYLPGKLDSHHPPGFFARFFAAKEKTSSSSRGVGRLTQAILGNRDLLILDDPFDGLSPAEIAEAKSLVREMVARGKSVILSSDSLMDVKDMCQRMVILHEGRTQAAGTLAELLSSGGAIRFLPAILPREMVERVLKVLREEINTQPVSTAEIPARAPATTPAVTQSKPETDDAIDHGKLEELTKQKKPE
jgi:ABC-2 type transport system ATP-binding protein